MVWKKTRTQWLHKLDKSISSRLEQSVQMSMSRKMGVEDCLLHLAVWQSSEIGKGKSQSSRSTKVISTSPASRIARTSLYYTWLKGGVWVFFTYGLQWHVCWSNIKDEMWLLKSMKGNVCEYTKGTGVHTQMRGLAFHCDTEKAESWTAARSVEVHTEGRLTNVSVVDTEASLY